MPELPSGQQAAAAPSTATPARPKHPDDAAEAEYHQMVEVFSKELKKVIPRKKLEGLLKSVDAIWESCSSCKFTRSDLLLSTYSIYKSFKDRQGDKMVNVLVQRTLMTAGVHERVLQALLGQETPTHDTCYCFLLLSSMMNQNGTHSKFEEHPQPDELSMEGVPAVCFPTPQQSYEALAPTHWHPRCIFLACKTLLSKNLPGPLKRSASRYLVDLMDPSVFQSASQSEALAVVASRADLNATLKEQAQPLLQVLRDAKCMSAIWELLQSPEQYTRGASLLKTLCNMCAGSSTLGTADSPAGSTGSSSPSPPAQLTHTLFHMGGADAIAAALKLHAEKLTEIHAKHAQHQQKPGTFAWLPGCEREHLWRLEAMVALLVVLRQAAHDGCAVWSNSLQQAHLHAVIQVMAEDVTGDVQDAVQGSPCAYDLQMYTRPSMLQKAASLLGASPCGLEQLLTNTSTFLVASLATDGFDASAWEGDTAFDAHTFLLQFLYALLSDEEASKLIQQQLQFDQLTKALGVLFLTFLSKRVVDNKTMLEKPGFIKLLKVTAKLCLCGGAARFAILPPTPEFERALKQLAEEEPSFWAAEMVFAGVGAPAPDDEDDDDENDDDVSSGSVPFSFANGMAILAGLSSVDKEGQSGTAHSAGVSDARPRDGLPVNGGGGGGAQSGKAGSTGSSTSVSSSRGSAGGPHTQEASGGGAAKRAAPVRTCAACGKVAKGLKCCSRCMGVYFCNATCQRAAWGSHRLSCVPRDAPRPP